MSFTMPQMPKSNILFYENEDEKTKIEKEKKKQKMEEMLTKYCCDCRGHIENAIRFDYRLDIHLMRLHTYMYTHTHLHKCA